MLCKSIEIKEKSNYIFSIKYNGERDFISFENNKVNVLRRIKDTNKLKENNRYPELKNINFNCNSCLIDGEVVCFNEKDKSIFYGKNGLQQRNHKENILEINKIKDKIPVVFMAFDILKLDGKSLMDKPIEKRLEILNKVVIENRNIKIVKTYNDFNDIWNMVKEKDLEGVIAKRKGSLYYFFKRTENWVKIKNFKRAVLNFNKYEINNDGSITADNGKNRVKVGKDIDKVKNTIDNLGNVNLEIQYLERTENGCYTQPTYKKVVEV